MIRVLHLITSLEVGGAQRMLVKLCRRMDRERFAVRVVSLVDGGALADELARSEVEVDGLGMRPGHADPRALLRLRRLLAAWRPDVLQSWLYHADLVGVLAGRLAGVPRIAWNLRCTFSAGAPGLSARMAPHLCARVSRRPDVIVTNSRAGRETHEAIGYGPRAWRLVPNGFDLERYRPDPAARDRLRSELGLDPRSLLAGLVARWHPMKGHATLLRIARDVLPRRPELHFVLAGSGVGPENPDFETMWDASGRPSNVHLLGQRADVPALMAGLDFLVSASNTYEGFPNVLGEAMAAGTPCVTTDVGDSAEVVGETGLVVPAGDEPALAGAVERMAALPGEERAALGARARERVAARYELGAVTRAYEALYEELAGKDRCAG